MKKTPIVCKSSGGEKLKERRHLEEPYTGKGIILK
jgi:hypothetical protein